MTPETQSKIAYWRAKEREGKLTREDMQEVIAVLAADRMQASIATARSRVSKAKAEIPAAVDILADMMKGPE